ncbi:hypothetical protein BDZ91DRAFT_554094 [Kalaharituber pfeilii]|nr:hypothetical protein BDZ91DRAFT_554094 [Kalaharituber pfeilii]
MGRLVFCFHFSSKLASPYYNSLLLYSTFQFFISLSHVFFFVFFCSQYPIILPIYAGFLSTSHLVS